MFWKNLTPGGTDRPDGELAAASDEHGDWYSLRAASNESAWAFEGAHQRYRRHMGSRGSKPRRPDHSQHLPKVGSSTENERLLHEEREAVLGQIGVRNAPGALKVVVTAVTVVLVVGAIVGLGLLIVFH